MTYRGKRRTRWGDQIQWVIAALLALVGLMFLLVRPWGMRFSGFLLVGLAVILSFEVFLDRWAKQSKGGWWCQLAWRAVLALVAGALVAVETHVIYVGQSDLSGLPAEAVIVLGAGVNGTEPSLSLQTRLDAALDYLTEHPDIPAVLTGGRGYGEEISEAQCMYDYLTERGVDPHRLILEDQASNTAENFAFSQPLLEAAGVDPAQDNVAVVTNDFHIARSRLIAARQGYGYAFGVPARLPWRHLEVNYYLRESFAMVKTVLFD